MDIEAFQGEYRWLSNFWPVPVKLDGVVYPTVENAYQAAKASPHLREPFRRCEAWQAKRLGRHVEMRADWDKAKLQVMRSLLNQKFAPSTELAARLMQTAPSKLIEGNTWGDVFWGVCRGRGQNMLGRMLMEVRASLLQTKETERGS
ncbi:MAG: NADAR family protein [Rhodocyclaceae bacterium]|nr:NADAR family protein [Rhodocyclaceae bacterium]